MLRNAVSLRRGMKTIRWSKTRGKIYNDMAMKRFYYAAILLASIGCERIEPDEARTALLPKQTAPAALTMHAWIDDGSRTSLGGERGTNVLWSAGDAIGLWGDTSPVNRRFEIDDRFAGDSSADFSGEAFESPVYYACYPYRSDAVVEDAGVTTTLPAVQPFGGSGTFAPGVSPMASRSTRTEMHFSSVCGVVRLQLTGTGTIRSVRLTALDGASLAGRMRIAWDAVDGGTMQPADAGHPSILLDCGAEGAALSASDPVVFCLVVPPGSYRGWRFTITDTAGGQMVRETSKAEVVLGANHIKTYNPFVYAASEAAPFALDAAATANCYVVPRAGRYAFDATTMGNGAVTPPDAEYAAGSTCGKADGIVPEPLRPAAVKLLWQTTPGLIRELSLGEEGRISFTTADPFVEGNAVVAACNADGTVLWSWHLWLTAADLEGTLQRYALSGDYAAAGEAVTMDRNLGALTAVYQGADNVSSYGMFYQWGRKDPFVPFRSLSARMTVYDAAGDALTDETTAAATFDGTPGWHVADGARLGETATVEAAVRYPMNFITDVTNGSGMQFSNWYYIPAGGRQMDDLWGCAGDLLSGGDTGTKSIYDPCPPGYRVPHRFVWTAFAPTADTAFSGWYVKRSNDGIVFDIAGQEIYYPAAGTLLGTTGRVRFMGSGWYVWGNSPYVSDKPMAGVFVKSSLTNKLLGSANRSYGAQVRCMKE